MKSKMDEAFLTYSALDSACMMEIYEKFFHNLGEYSATYQMTIELLPVLTFMQTKGMLVNHTLLNETKVEVLTKAAELQEELNALVGKPLNVNSSKQCASYFYVELGIAPIYNGKTKSVTTDDLAMQRLVRGTAKHPGLRQAKLVQEIRGLQKLHSTYLDIAFDEDDRLRGSYNPRGTKFGRLSSSKTVFGTGMNYQNLPQEFKKFLIPDEGYFLLELDKRQAEWIVIAYLADDANMIAAITEGLDVHAHTASLMFGVPIEIVSYEHKAVGHITNPDMIAEVRSKDEILKAFNSTKWPRTMSLRQCGKKSNHGLNYDERYRNFALINEMLETEAKRVIDLYHTIYPGIHLYYETVKRQLQKDRTLTNCFGRKVGFLGEWNEDLWKSAYSMLPQSTVVDSLNKGMVHIYHDESITRELGLDILAQVHDSILMQIPIRVVQDKEVWESLLTKLKTYLTPTLCYNGREFTIATDGKVGLNWGGEHKGHNKQGMRDLTTHEDLLALLSLEDSNG